MMGTEIFKIDASWAEKLTKTRVSFLMNPTVNFADTNECLRNPCGKNAECSNTEGSYQCTCRAGLTGDPFVACSDTDECAAQTNPCGGEIVNLDCRYFY